MYSLTEATRLLIKHYETWLGNNENNIINRYNTHKLRHSNWVLEVWRNLLIKIKENKKFSEEELNRAEIVLLLHDIARFHQNNKERILTNEEFEHWDEAYKILKQENYDEKICLAVKYHNKYDINWLYEEKTFVNLEEKDKNETIFLAKFIRDADKLQNMIYELFDLEWLTKLNTKLKKWDISDNIINDIKLNIPVNRVYVETIADEVLRFIWWSFDINFRESIDMLNYYNFFEAIFNKLKWLNVISINKLEEVENIIIKFISKNP